MKRKFIYSVSIAVLVLFQWSTAQAQCTVQNVTWKGWSMSFLRPSCTSATTSGGRGGGLEIQNAKYNGKLVFTKAHTPIINVRYMNNACGPYRDWQDEEQVFKCTNVTATGRCDGPATTNCEVPGGGDIGTFTGVSVNKTPSEMVLTSSVQAGWYRYIFRWHFFSDGTFHPEGFFGATQNGCTTATHLHMMYFRVDMDVEGNTNNVEEHNTYKNVPDGGQVYWESWDPIFTETARLHQQDGSRWWRIRNATSGRAYLIYPPDMYPGGGISQWEFGIVPQMADIWFLKYNTTLNEETDDAGSFSRYWAHLTQFVNDTESTDDGALGQDWVIWYGGGALHQTSAVNPACHSVQGPYFTPDPKGTSW